MIHHRFGIRFLLFASILFYFSAATAQSSASGDTSVVKLFPAGTKLQWVKHYTGRFDDAYGLVLDLAYDGKQLKGYALYPKSKTRLRLEGKLLGGAFRLEERDAKDGMSGIWQGKIQDRRIDGEWLNYNNSIGGRIELEEGPATAQNAPKNCGDNKWLNRYAGKWNNTDVDLTLLRANNGVMSGSIWLQAENKTYLLKGEAEPSGHYILEAPLFGAKSAVELDGVPKNAQTLECSYRAINGEKRPITFAQRDNLNFSCYEYADYISSFDVLYPKTRCSNCNDWLETQIVNWVNRCRANFAARKDAAIPSNRNLFRAGGWSNIVCWSEDILSGYMIFTESWSEQSDGFAFNFDIRTGKAMEMEDIFDKKFQYKTWLQDYVKKESPKLPGFGADPKFREWVYKSGFPLLAWRREGLGMSTLFHPVYGQHHLIVPYATLKPFIKKGAPIEQWIK